jgi:hypothetical protein
MRDPIRKAGLWFALALTGAGGVAIASTAGAQIGQAIRLIVGVIGLTAVAVGAVLGVTALLAAIGHARLRRGIGVIARWNVGPQDWARFRAFDAERHAAYPDIINEFKAMGEKPETGIEVIAGRRQIMIDGSYHLLRRFGVPDLRSIGWLAGPAQLEVIEFGLLYPRGRSGGTIQAALRVPVVAQARGDAVRVFEHYRALIPAPREGLAFRRPGLVIGWGAALAALSAGVALTGYLLDRAGAQGLAPALMAVVGMLAAGGASIFTLVVALAVAGRRAPPKRGTE